MIKELVSKLAYDEIKISQALTQSKLIESKIRNQALKTWLTKELEGYEFDDNSIPDYRVIFNVVQLTAQFPFGRKHNFPVRLKDSVGEEISKFSNYHKVYESIPNLEFQLSNLKTQVGYYKLPSNIVDAYSGLFNDQLAENDGYITDAFREISKAQLQNVIDLTKQKLLDTLLELDQLFPNLSNEYKMSKENDEKINNIITNHIYGNNNPMNIATGHTVQQSGNSISLSTVDYNKLKDLGVDENQIEELKQILVSNQNDKPTLTGKVFKWIGGIAGNLAAKGLAENMPAITEFVHKLIS